MGTETPEVRLLKHLPVGLLLLVAVVGCSAGSEPAQQPDAALPTLPVTATQPRRVPPTTTVTASPTPLVFSPTPEPPAFAEPPGDTEVAANQAITYVVQPGDTLWGIAIAHDAGLDELLAANDLADPDMIWAGQELVIPNPATTPPPEVQAAASQTSSTTEDLSMLRQVREQIRDTAQAQPLQDQVLLEPMLHDWQKMNNCAPTTVAMALSYYNLLLTQFDTAPVLKGGPQDKNVSPSEIVAYLHNQGFGGVVRVNGNIETLQRLVSNNTPVIVEQWLDRPDDELTGHYRLVRGYDRSTQEIIVNDSYSGPRLRFSYAEFDRLWRPFNRVYVPVYQPGREPVVRAIIGDNWDDRRMYELAVESARAETDSPGDVYAWFNLGNSLLDLGEYAQAVTAFDRAIEIGLPPRMLWYQFGPFEALNLTSQFQRVLELSSPLTGLGLEELHYQRGVAYEGLGQRAVALGEYRRAAELNPRLVKAVEAAARLNHTNGS
ncbi:MAG: C39 family peptidase [Anaerolineae bacterium]